MSLHIHIFGVKDSMGCYFGGTITTGNESDGCVSGDSVPEVFEMLMEIWRSGGCDPISKAQLEKIKTLGTQP